MSNESQRWMQAGIALSNDPKLKVNCPSCQEGILMVKDIASELGDNSFERVLSCPKCNVWNSIRMSKK